MSVEFSFPKPPDIKEADLEKCRADGDYCPVMFEWYKYVGLICNLFASIQRTSPAIRELTPIHYHILVGLLNRCARLILSNVVLSHEGRFGETTIILDRCICESAIKILWLCQMDNSEDFTRYLADGLKADLELKAKILSNVKSRDGKLLAIEKRMLASIENYINSSGLSEEEINSTKKLPDMASMIDSLGADRLLYIVSQKMASHHIHGTWLSLRLHYLEEDAGELQPRDHDCLTHINQFIFVPLVVLEALRAFTEYICTDSQEADMFKDVLKSMDSKIRTLNQEIVGKDFQVLENEI